MRWQNEEVLIAWARNRTPEECKPVLDAMRRATREGGVSGEMVGSLLDPYRRVIETEVANIYFTSYGRAWNSAHDTLYLLAIE